MTKRIFYLSAIVLFSFIFSIAPYAAAVTEVEPNNSPEQANLINIGDTVTGKINYGDGSDYFKLTLPRSGIVRVNISGYPSDCSIQIGAAGFQKYATTPVGWVRSDSGSPATFSFSAQGKFTGYIYVSLASVASGVCSGSEWCALQCKPNGPYYLQPFHDRALKNVPGSYNNKPLVQPIQYQFQVAFQPVPDQYEPNFEELTTKEQMLQKGIIKTIPVGREITAYLFNDYPRPMRGTKGYENTGTAGGEDDTDIYHIYLNQPDTVKVTLRDFPQNANSRIMITDSSGSWDESKTGVTYFERKVTKPGNVFIEISRGRESRPLVYSTTPYKMLVTVGAGSVVPPEPIRTEPIRPVTSGVITVDQTVVYAGEKITIRFSGLSSPSQTDWISIYKVGTPNQKYGEWYYLKGQSSGVLTFTVPNEPGEYEFRLFLNWSSGGYNDVAKSRTVRVLPKGQVKKDREMINNGNLRGLSGWTISEWYKPSGGKGEVISESDGIRFRSTSGNNRIGILQDINADVSSCSSLILTATVKADYHTLTGTGYNGREASVAVFARYTDVNGVLHDPPGENPNDSKRMFWHGFYYLDPTPPSISLHGTKISKGAWYTFSFDLMTLNPKPGFIHYIGAEGAGWSSRDGKIGSISLKCNDTSVQPAQPQQYQPTIPQQYEPQQIQPQQYQPQQVPDMLLVPSNKGQDEFMNL
ncbi:MAG: hypothetical protein C0415_06415 [Thermodesulfovibrio sp.]|nr:hypothetical protein [Thermodesulfovibrio sp.]